MIKAKMKVESVKHTEWSEFTTLRCEYSNTPEDNSFAKATPTGMMELQIDNPAVKGMLKPGKKVFITITDAE